MKCNVSHYLIYQCIEENCSVLHSSKATCAIEQEQLVNIEVSTFLIGGEIGSWREPKKNCVINISFS